jgi:flagellar biosynthesis/type III secretory pathway chaperone
MSRNLIRNILNILDNEYKVLIDLLSLEENKNKILTTRDLEELNCIIQAENILSETLNALEEERLILMEKNGLKPNLTDFIIDADEEHKQELMERQQLLVDCLRRLKLYNEMNNRILAESIKFFKYSIDLFTGESAASRIYAPNGMEGICNSEEKRSLVLDQKI